MTDENELMQQVKNGQLDCLAVLFERNKSHLFNFFRQMGKSKEISEDLVQETFMRVLASRSSYNSNKNFKSWLFGIARNTSIDHYRKYKKTTGYEELDESSINDEKTLTSELEKEQKLSLFDQALRSIPSELREIIVLSRYQQMRYEDIASMFSCNLNTLKSRMSLAIKKLQESYDQLNNDENKEEV